MEGKIYKGEGGERSQKRVKHRQRLEKRWEQQPECNKGYTFQSMLQKSQIAGC